MSHPLGGLRGWGQKVKSEHSHVAYQRTSDTLIGYLPIFLDASQNFPMYKISLVSF